MARDSIVLLKNQNNLLPLNPTTTQKIAVIGPLANNTYDSIGPWAGLGWDVPCATVLDGIKSHASQATVSFALGSNFEEETTQQIEEAVALAKNSDIVVMVLGENKDMSGEAACRSDI